MKNAISAIEQFGRSFVDMIEESILYKPSSKTFVENTDIYNKIPINEVTDITNKIKDFPFQKLQFGLYSFRFRWIKKKRLLQKLQKDGNDYMIFVKAKARNYEKTKTRSMDVRHRIYFNNPGCPDLICEILVETYMKIPISGTDLYDEVMMESCSIYANAVLKYIRKLILIVQPPTIQVPTDYKSLDIISNKKFDGYVDVSTSSYFNYEDDDGPILDPIEVSKKELENNDKVILYDILKNKRQQRGNGTI